MGVLKVSIYQKSLPEGLNLTIYKKLAALKSDFLLFPEYFYADSTVKTPESLLDRSQHAQDWLQKLNDAYRGIIIGGSVLKKEEDGTVFTATPLVSEGSIVDWYRKRDLGSLEKEMTVTPGKDPGIFILGGHRFAVLLGEDIRNRSYLEELKEMGIHLIFHMTASLKKEESLDAKHSRDRDLFSVPAEELGLTIVKCGGTGQLLNQPLQGRSLVAAPSGISWRVAPHEEESEIVKTVMLNLPA